MSSNSVRINGSSIGKDSTGYKVPLELAFEIIAAIIVDETAMPIFPKKNAMANNRKFCIIKEGNSIENKIVITKFIRKTSKRLKINLPE